MNHIYRSIWNETTGTFVAVSENTKAGGKKASGGASGVIGAGFALKTLVVSLLLAFGSNSYALPANGTVAAGSAAITGSGNNMTINQSSQNVVLNWQSFNIGAGETVRFAQPNSNSVALNRVLGADPSSIFGTLSANGKVFIVNPNGILFGKSASVNVGGLVASTLTISDSDFMAGKYRFAGTGVGSVLNQGLINADGGYVALMGANVSNDGTINARLGSVTLAAGKAITLDIAGDGLLNVTVDQGAVNALVQNGGLIQADGGQVLLTAQAAGNLLQTVVNNTGIIQAQTIEKQNGTIKLLGDMQGGTVNVGGKLDASAPNGGNGGSIETSAANVKMASSARVTTAAAQGLTGSWLIDPTDYNIAASGGDITGALLATSLASTNVTILSSSGSSGSGGNVNVNDVVSWSANKLTLNAQNNININTAMHGSGTASLALEYGQGAVAASNASTVNVRAPVNLPSGNNLSTKLGSDGTVINYTVINSLGVAGSTTGTDLQGMNGGLTGNYALGSNIDASATNGWNAGTGFMPVGTGGDYGTPFSGRFEGLGHTISNLTINRLGTDYTGLFSATNGSTISNVGLIGSNITGGAYVGALVGQMSGYGTVTNSYATGSVTGSGNRVGGLVGDGQGTIDRSYSTATISGAAVVGGLVGGGGVDIKNSYATGAVTGSSYIGGLVGAHEGGAISNSYATGAVSGSGNNVGGLAGYIFANTMSNTYATGAVSGGGRVGGLIGMRDEHGAGPSTITNSYWNTDVYTPGIGFSYGVTTGTSGLTSAQMQTTSNFSGFNFTSTPGATGNNWVMVGIDGTLNSAGGTRPMLASEYSTTINNAHQLQLMSMNLAGSYTLGQNIDAAATGTVSNVWSSGTFVPVGKNSASFTGTLNGAGHTISALNINMPDAGLSGFSLTATADEAGLFGNIGASGSVKNVGLVGGSVVGRDFVGALAGKNDGTITNSYASTAIQGRGFVGGLVGHNTSTATTNGSHAAGSVIASGGTVGGLVGLNDGVVSNNYATGAVQGGESKVGGLVGLNYGSISNSYASGSVSGSVTGSNYVGGLVGMNYHNSISNSYATGAVQGNGFVGGLIGFNYDGGVNNSYATGLVQGVSNAGGLMGNNYGTVTNSFWNTDTSGQAASVGGNGLTNQQMMQASSFSSWNTATPNTISSTGGSGASWRIYEGHTAPLLTQFLTALTRSDTVVATYNGTAQGATGVLPGGVLAATATNAGTYDAFYSNQQGYDISGGTLTINKATLTLSGTRVYDGTSAVAGSTLTATGVAGETFAVTGTGNTSNLASKNVQTGSTLASITGLALGSSTNGGLSTNYNALSTTGSSVSISKANLTLSTSNVTKTYDGSVTATGTVTTTSGTLFGSDSLSGGTFAFTDKNVGSGNKTVTTSGVTVSDGNSGGNYNITYVNNTTSTITRLNSVTWTGGVTGNWFDPTNWSGGAVPDLSNVANVIIPAGVTVSFNNGSVVSPAQAGAVNVDSIGSLGGMTLAAGSLNVTNSLQLANLDQSGGTFNSTGNVSVANFTQSGGAMVNAGNFTATNSFSQSGGTVNAGGSVSITQASGSVTLGNITSGSTLGVTAATGNVVQAAGTSIVAGGTVTLAAPNGNVTLVSSGNSLGTPIITSGGSSAPQLQNAVTNAVSAALRNSNTNSDNTSISLVSFGQSSLPVVASNNSIQNMLAGLNVSITGQGLNLPDGVLATDATDDKK